MSDTIKDDCLFCIDHEAGSTLYEYSSWEGGIEFRTIENIKYCPLCGKRLLSEEAYSKMLDERFRPNKSGEAK